MIKKFLITFMLFVLFSFSFSEYTFSSESKDSYIVKFKENPKEVSKNLNIPTRDITCNFSFGHISVVKLNKKDKENLENNDNIEYIAKNNEINKIPESKDI
ncbi:hypothetical protein JGU61_13775 [Staphylococcus aureus]|uniref:hypothetical protein n=1 Tax=Staphylococcus aureus TaxID=1280 RepID=UPI0018EDB1F6|nr:hypothetical protein [Staphylococcus aureus]MBJ6291912.1 hypothetical protein [Staphylococcus aureus]MBJ6294654.1 hypothetical protein [Staphylococcus aureus]MBJ6296137.1 hypothetical protein [Staphylococcus aureus]MBJ6307272.1 hypothetical protein [Staphylococcus aureus]MBJ6350861.1 hypothetical protein [Staphylococcus aureus]